MVDQTLMTKVGFIGVGRMGKPMAINVLNAGFDLMVYDLRAESLREFDALGAKIGHSAREVGQFGDVIEIAVVGDDQVEAVLLEDEGVLESARPGAVIAIHSTIHPRTVKKIAELANASGVEVIDAEVSGGEIGARSQTLCYMVGGAKTVFDKCRPIFATSGSNVFHVGELGTGAVTKIVLQTVVCINMLAASEGMMLAEKAGLNFRTFQEILHVSAGQSMVADNWFERFKVGDAPMNVRRRRLEVFHKGLLPALELAHELDVSLPGVALTQQLLARILDL